MVAASIAVGIKGRNTNALRGISKHPIPKIVGISSVLGGNTTEERRGFVGR
jgi:hypothetical protein